TSWNRGAERLFGYSAPEIVGTTISRLVPPDRPNDATEILACIRRGERVDHYETERMRKDGQRIHASLTVSPITEATGRIIGASKIARDVSARRRAEAERERLLRDAQAARSEAEAANRAKDELMSVVSHELRTPLSSMLGWVSVLRKGKMMPDGVQRALEAIERNGRLQSELINDLLDVSRMVSGRLVLDPRPVELRRVLGDALDAARPDAAASGIRMSADITSEATVAGDALRLQQVVSNLLSNAIKFTPRGGAIEILLQRRGADARVTIRDDGRGIAPEFLPHVFEPFRQAEDVKRRKTGGLGLGLAIVRNLVEQHGGSVSAESAGEGTGATFTVTLPLLADRRSGRGLTGVRVLVVHDEADACDELRALLERRGA
ncbi:MAG TPA: PAS domain-containing sensor histidine kinase, partial [Caldimonas sp.]|nr:PAS domain-containing sensor histidine kinase [Caldimonas sp.]